MIDNPSNPPNPGVTRRAPRNHPEITQKSPRNHPEIGFGKTLPFGRVFYWVREREKIKGSQLGYWKVS